MLLESGHTLLSLLCGQNSQFGGLGGVERFHAQSKASTELLVVSRSIDQNNIRYQENTLIAVCLQIKIGRTVISTEFYTTVVLSAPSDFVQGVEKVLRTL